MDDLRVTHLNDFAMQMSETKIIWHPLRTEVIVSLSSKTYDQYQDAVTVETQRIKKFCILRKNPDIDFVQTIGGEFDVLADEDNVDNVKLPWVVVLTMLNLPRLIVSDDYMIIDGYKYAVSVVKPVNRFRQSVLDCLIYPERTNIVDALKVYSITYSVNGVVITDSVNNYIGQTVLFDVLCGGKPTFYSFDGATWLPFASYMNVVLTTALTNYYVSDAQTVDAIAIGNTVTFKIS